MAEQKDPQDDEGSPSAAKGVGGAFDSLPSGCDARPYRHEDVLKSLLAPSVAAAVIVLHSGGF